MAAQWQDFLKVFASGLEYLLLLGNTGSSLCFPTYWKFLLSTVQNIFPHKKKRQQNICTVSSDCHFKHPLLTSVSIFLTDFWETVHIVTIIWLLFLKYQILFFLSVVWLNHSQNQNQDALLIPEEVVWSQFLQDSKNSN